MSITSSLEPDPALAKEVAELREQLRECRAEVGALNLQLAIMSTTDPVSGLPNLTGLMDIITSACALTKRSGEPFGLMLVRIPELGDLAASRGREAYWDAIRHTASLVVAALRQVDRVARLDSSALVAMLPRLTRGDVEGVAARISTVLGAVPLAFEDGSLLRLRPEIAALLADRYTTPDAPLLLEALHEAALEATYEDPYVTSAPADEPAGRFHQE